MCKEEKLGLWGVVVILKLRKYIGRVLGFND